MSLHVLGRHARDRDHRGSAGRFTLGGRRTAMRGWASERRARSARRGSPGVLLHPRDLVLLGWLAEQYAATTDQLGVLLGCADFLEIHGLIHDHPIPFIWLAEHTHPPTELRIDRLRTYTHTQPPPAPTPAPAPAETHNTLPRPA
jgi:hypothetical protein